MNFIYKNTNKIRSIIALVYGSWFIYIGINHFIDPEWFKPIVPSILRYPVLWVYFSGLCEIVLGLLLIFKQSRKFASICFVIMLILIYWANINMWVNDIPIDGKKLSSTGHITRAIIQGLIILLVLWIGKIKPFNK